VSGPAAEPPWAARRPGRPREPDFEAKREAVLAAAAALMAKRGYDGMSLADLAEALGVTKPTLYHYVGGKEQLFAEIVARSQRATIDFMRGVAEAGGTGAAKLRRILVGYMQIVNSDFGTSLTFSGPAVLGPETLAAIQARSREANEVIYRVFAEGQADGTLAIDDPTLTLHTLFGALNWSPTWYRPGGRLTLREAAEAQADILLVGVKGPGS
jgi:AcrR family transcriptional regulator